MPMAAATRLMLILGTIILYSVRGSGQLFLQLERAGSLKVKKYPQGTDIQFKTKAYPDYWQNGKIYQIIPEEQSVVFSDRITYLRDYTHFRFQRSWPNALGTNLTRFGVSWFAFAGLLTGLSEVGALENPFNFGTDTVIIGASALVTGYLTKKLFTTVTRKINGKNRLRIIDLRL